MIRIVLVLLLVGTQTLPAQDPVRLDTRTADRIWFENVSFEKSTDGSDILAIDGMESVNKICATGIDLLQVYAGAGSAFCTIKNSHIRQIHRDSAVNLMDVSTMFDFRDGIPTKLFPRNSGRSDEAFKGDTKVRAHQCSGDTNAFVFREDEEISYCLRGPTFREDAFTMNLVGDAAPDLVVRSINDSIWYNIVPNGSTTPFDCDQTIHVPGVPGRSIVTETVTNGGLVVVARDTGAGPTNHLYAMELSITEHGPDSVTFSWRDFSSLSIRCDSCEQPTKWYVGKDGKNGDTYIYRSFKNSMSVHTTLVERLSNRRLERIAHVTNDHLVILGTLPGSQFQGVPIVLFYVGSGDELYFARLDNISKPFGFMLLEGSTIRLKQFRIIRDGNGDNKPDVLQAQYLSTIAPFNLLNIYDRFELAGPTSVSESSTNRDDRLALRGYNLLLDGNETPCEIEIYTGVGTLETQFAVPGGTFQCDLAPYVIGKAPGLRLVVRRLRDRVQTVSFILSP